MPSDLLHDTITADGWMLTPSSPFNTLVGPFWRRGAGKDLELGFMPEQCHTNHVDIVHGGMIMTFMDLVLGLSTAEATGNTHAVTIQLNTSFVGGARRGELLIGHARVSRTTRTVLFVRGEVTSASGLVATAEGIWKALRPDAVSVTANRSS